MFIKAPWKLDDFFTAIIADELNVKAVAYKDDVRAFTSYSFKPQLKTLGPKYGKFLGEIRTQLTNLDGNEAMDSLNKTGFLTLSLNGTDIQLEKADLLIEMAQQEGFVASSDKGITVVMDTNLTAELIEEGFVRELVSKLQTMRKDADFEVMDRINVYVDGNEKIAELFRNNAEQIKSIVLADDIFEGSVKGFTKEWNINGENVTLGVSRIEN
jgi:isoleucyl-tRNA synthetase